MLSWSAVQQVVTIRSQRHKVVFAMVLMVALILAATLFGILTRPIGFLAAFWPANALLLGLMLRLPYLSSPPGWLLALLAYMLPDLMFGYSIDRAAALAFSNLAFVSCGLLVFQRYNQGAATLDRPAVVLYLLLACVVGAAAATLCGLTLVRAVAPELFTSGLPHMGGFWFTSELVNGILFLPLMLLRTERRQPPREQVEQSSHQALPLLLLIASVLLAVQLDGPGRIGLPVPALLWCALSYSVGLTAMLSSATSIAMMLLIGGTAQHADISDDYIDILISSRLGIALIALGPLAVGCVNSARNQLLARMEFLVSHDHLTSVLGRAGFYARGQSLLGSAISHNLPVAVMVLDIDHFKTVNDRYGHAAGDQVLREFSQVVAQTLRAQDVFGRTGGEEFSVMVEGIGLDSARILAERIVERAAAHAVVLPDGQRLAVTVSIGLAWYESAKMEEIDGMLKAADEALYQAKEQGRNRVVSVVA